MKRPLFALLALLFALVGLAAPTYAAPAPAGTTTHTYTATATVSRLHPTMNQVETIAAKLLDHGTPVAGAQMTTQWYYKTTTSTCTGVTLTSGWASCSRSISHATPGYKVVVRITFVKAGKVLASTSTSFTPAGQSSSGSNTGGTSTGGGSSGSSGVRTGATCRDGTHSNATGSGACSHHGGVDHWLYGP